MKTGNLILILIIIIAAVGISLFIMQETPEVETKVTVDESMVIAENFIRNSPTYRFDGFNLGHAETKTLRCPYCWEFIFEFQSRHSGYGDRTGKVFAQVITEHRARVIMDNGVIIYAIIDDEWDELNQKNFRGNHKEALLTLSRDIYSLGEKIQFTFEPGAQRIYAGRRWQIYKFEDNDWKCIPTGMLFGCRPADCVNGRLVNKDCLRMIIKEECHELLTPVSDSWDQKYWTTEKRMCGNQTYEFDVLSQVEPGRYKVRYSYATDSDCERYSYVEKEFEIIEKNMECAKDSDCGTGGCSGQVCTTAERAKEIITTCEMRAEYGCLRLTTCGCVEGKCQWRKNSAYIDCMDRLKSG